MHQLTHSPQRSFEGAVSEIVRSDYRTADTFKKYNINYCCGGLASLEDACMLASVDYHELLCELRTVTANLLLPAGLRFDLWQPGFLVDYLVNVHHATAANAIASIQATMSAFMKGHRNKHTELPAIEAVLTELTSLVQEHNHFKEQIVFPYIRHLENFIQGRLIDKKFPIYETGSPVDEMKSGHAHLANLLHQLWSLTNGFAAPPQACTNHFVLYHKMQSFFNDLLQHQYLENDILYPKAIEMERQMYASQTYPKFA